MTVTVAVVTIGAASAADVFATSSSGVRSRWYRNRGPNDATIRTGGTASGASTEFLLPAGERFDPPYRTTLKVSAYSVLGTTIEGEEWT